MGPAVGAHAVEALTLQFADAAGLPRKPARAARGERRGAGRAIAARRRRGGWQRRDDGGSGGGGGGAGGALSSPKLRKNVLLLLTYLLMFYVAHSNLLGGVLRVLAARFTEVDVELLLLALTFGGFQLRADDPAALRDVLRDVHARVAAAKASAGAGAAGAPASGGRAATAAAAAGAAAAGFISGGGGGGGGSSSGGGGGLGALIARFAAGGGAMGAATTSAAPAAAGTAGAAGTVSRLDVLSELLLDLKNNRKRAEHAQLLERGGALRKLLSRLAAKTRGGALEGVDRRVRVGWGDIMLIPQRGR